MFPIFVCLLVTLIGIRFNAIKNEYNSAATDFDLNELLLIQISLIYSFEQLLSSVIKFLKSKKSAAKASKYFKLLLQYYNSVYDYANYTGCINGFNFDYLKMLSYIQVDNTIAKSVSFEMFYDAYKSTKSSTKNHRGPFVLASSELKWCLVPCINLVLFFHHEVAVMNN